MCKVSWSAKYAWLTVLEAQNGAHCLRGGHLQPAAGSVGPGHRHRVWRRVNDGPVDDERDGAAAVQVDSFDRREVHHDACYARDVDPVRPGLPVHCGDDDPAPSVPSLVVEEHEPDSDYGAHAELCTSRIISLWFLACLTATNVHGHHLWIIYRHGRHQLQMHKLKSTPQSPIIGQCS